MNVTEHNIQEWQLTSNELDELIQMTKEKMKSSENSAKELFYGMIVGKLIIMKNE